MGLYRRLARSKRGMATIFGGLFFVILILMGFNLMLWGFIQMDAYNSVVTSMGQRDQLAAAENLVPTNPGATDITSNSFNITVNNLGGTSVSIARIYINNILPSGVTQCSGTSAPCIVDPAGASSTGYSFTNGNVIVGALSAKISVSGITICGPSDKSGYQVTLATTRGRLFSFFCPWPQPLPPGGGVFTTNVGPLQIFFDFSSFNFTMGSQTQSQTAWIVPTSTTMVFYVKVVNTAPSSVCLLPQSAILFQRYSTSGNAGTNIAFIADPTTIYPNNVIPLTTQQCLPAGNPNGPSVATLVKFTATAQSGTTPMSFQQGTIPYLLFIGFFYTVGGIQPQGETVPFVAIRACNTYPVTTGC